MTGEELNRKYWELCGWTDFSWMPLSEVWVAANPHGKRGDVPRLHLDANLAIVEANKKHQLWTMRQLDGKFLFMVGNSTGEGSTFGEAFLDFEIKDQIAAKESQ